MNRNDALALLAVTAVLTVSAIVTERFTRSYQPATTLTFTEKEAKVASEKTAALKALFESDSFKAGNSHDQRRLIEAIDKLYL